MKRSKRSIAITWLTSLSLVFSLCAGIILIDIAKAAPRREQDGSIGGRKKDGVASDLREQMRCHNLRAPCYVALSQSAFS